MKTIVTLLIILGSYLFGLISGIIMMKKSK